MAKFQSTGYLLTLHGETFFVGLNVWRKLELKEHPQKQTKKQNKHNFKVNLVPLQDSRFLHFYNI